MKEGIYIKDVLHRGPALESGKLNPGDRINSVTISFEHIVYEDALTILSYASPYEVIIEARSGKPLHGSTQATQPSHPIYRSSSCTDINSKRKLFDSPLNSNSSSLQKTRSNMTTLERKESESPKSGYRRPKKQLPKLQLSPDQLKTHLEQKILVDHQQNLKNKVETPCIETEVQKSGNKFEKFGVRVLPPEKSPKTVELSHNDNNINIEVQGIDGIDEVDDQKPQIKKRERKITPEKSFNRDDTLNNSGIKRDANGIPQEIPNFMMNAAVAARSNRRGSEDQGRPKEDDNDKTPKKLKGKAPSPPETKNLDEIQSASDNVEVTVLKDELDDTVELRIKSEIKDYNSDSDLETDNQSSVNTIELNSSDITIHAEETEDRQNRKTVSTGDLTKIEKTRKSSNGTLERAQSLDITDTGIPTMPKKRKGGRIEDMGSEDDIFGKVMMSKEPRLSLILDGLNTFQRNRLKKSTEWGNLEDAILKLNQEEETPNSPTYSLENMSFDFGEKTQEFDALVNKINEIKRESIEITAPIKEELPMPVKLVKNEIWPLDLEINSNGNASISEVIVQPIDDNPRLISAEKRQRKPPIPNEIPPPVLTKPPVPEKKDFLIRTQSFNKSDESKSQELVSLVDLTKNFIFTEKLAASHNDEESYQYAIKSNDTNIPDDIKVSRHTMDRPKSDDAKMNISNVTVNNVNPEPEEILESNNASELYTTALETPVKPDISKITISTPDIIKNVSIAEAINKLNNEVQIHGPSSLTIVKDKEFLDNNPLDNKLSVEIEDTTLSSLENTPTNNSSLTYITEIQVLTPNNTSTASNISEIEIIPTISSNGRNLDNEFEDYIRNFETNVQKFENAFETSPKSDSKSITINDNIDAEKELSKIHEIAEEQLKKLPEMRFTTSSYEGPRTPSEKRQSQIELLRSNFEKSPPRSKGETKSRIPIATTAKTPPTSPERRDSRNLDLLDQDKEILELMSSSVHSTPMIATSKHQIKPPKNVTVTSIRTNSKIPSGLPVLSGSNRPPIPPRKQEGDEHVVQVSTNGNVESSFKQWVFNPSEHSVTNIVVVDNKQQK